jgi:hypothetical protein
VVAGVLGVDGVDWIFVSVEVVVVDVGVEVVSGCVVVGVLTDVVVLSDPTPRLPLHFLFASARSVSAP